jgi:general secretion pathway protein H
MRLVSQFNVSLRQAHSRRARGVTLLELILVLVLIAILSVAAAPMIGRGMGTMDQRAAAQKVSAALKHARNLAVSKRTDVAVTFNVKTLTVSAPELTSFALPNGVALDLTTIEKERVDEDSAGIRFYPDGGSTGGRVTLKKGERTLRVDVDWLTGRVRVEEDA